MSLVFRAKEAPKPEGLVGVQKARVGPRGEEASEYRRGQRQFRKAAIRLYGARGCVNCGRREWELDKESGELMRANHITPLARGGENDALTNGELLCSTCDRLFAEAQGVH